ncbi:MAG TPA: hypothetical protein VLI72_11775 [Methylibium sp.]|nr:hypothetical protein [Methylibium sp.]
MFKPVPFEPAGYRRSRGRPPRWLLLLLCGLAAGAGGVLYVQAYHLPPRLSAEAGERLRSALDRAEAEQRRLSAELADVSRKLEETLAQKDGAVTAHAASRTTIDQLKQDVATLVAALPADPRGGSVSVRSGELSARNGKLTWELVLSRSARPGGAPLPGVLQLVVAGETASGSAGNVTLAPVPLRLGPHEVLRGTAPLPEGFRPRQTTIQVLDRVGGSSLGMRVLLVQ